MSSPLIAYSFDGYSNFVMSNFNGKGFSMATKGFNKTHFKMYVSLEVPAVSTACAIVAIGAKDRYNWEKSDILAVSLSPTGPSYVSIKDMLGGNGEKKISGVAANQDWTFVQTGSDPSSSYSSLKWKLEVLRPYIKTENGVDMTMYHSEQTNNTPVSINLYPNECPSGSFDYGNTNALIGSNYPDQMKPEAVKGNSSFKLLVGIVVCLIATIMI